jgi:hypothetical protein
MNMVMKSGPSQPASTTDVRVKDEVRIGRDSENKRG